MPVILVMHFFLQSENLCPHNSLEDFGPFGRKISKKNNARQRKNLVLMPVAALIVSGCLVLKDISLYTTSEPTIARKLVLYFHNDVSMDLYLIYAPITGIAVITTVIACLFNHYRRKLD